jgi:hypothetical protein
VKQTEKQPKLIEFRFFLVQTENNFLNIFCLFRGHPCASQLTESGLGQLLFKDF